MADLVTRQEFKDYAHLTVATDDTLIDALLDATEALLELQCNRPKAPFAAAPGQDVTEIHDGTGGKTLFLHYPIGTLTSVKLGEDPQSPDETLSVSDKSVLRYEANRRRLVRVDGGLWGKSEDPLVIHVTYRPAADLPKECAQAVKRVAAAVYNQIGSEGTASQNVGGFSHTLEKVAENDPMWTMAVQGNTRIPNL